MFRQKILITLLLGGLFSVALNAQNFKKVLGRPYAFEKPLNNETYYLMETKKKENNVPWVVICDRSSKELNQTFAAPGEGVVVKQLKYKDWFYVVDEKGDWIRIAKAKLSKGVKVQGQVNDFGWIHKKNMLLWTSGLLSSKTQINLKAFLLNKKEDIAKIIRLEKKEVVKIFSGPETEETVGQKTIYEFYFIMKKEGDRFLLAKEARLSPNSVTDWKADLVGWVREGRLTEWDTRICLEPNFQKDAFKERQDNEKYQMRAFSTESAAETHASKASITNSEVEWENDPVKLSPNQLASKDPKRFKGGVVRFPMLYNTTNYYSTGVIGEIHVGQETIGEVPYSGIVDELNNNSISKDNYSIFFLIEGSSSMQSYKQSIVETIISIKKDLIGNVKNVQFGAAIYRDGLEKEKDKIFKLQPFTDQLGQVTGFIEESEFGQWHDNDNYTCLHYGLSESIKNAGFNDAYTNIVYVIGNYGDYSSHVLRKRKAQNEDDPTLIVDTQPIIEKLSELNVHLIGVQCKRDDGKRSGTFTDQCQDLILESAKLQYSSYKDATKYISDLKLVSSENIKLEDASSEGISRLIGAAAKGFVAQPEEGQSSSTDKVTTVMKTAGSEVNEFVRGFWGEMSRIVDEGAPIDNVSAGPFAPAAARQIMDLINSSSSGFSKEDVQKIAKNKYKLYTKVYIPKHIEGAFHPTHSFVLFMPDKDLEDYMTKIEQITYALNGASPDELRVEIYNMFIGLLKYYTGNDNQKSLSKKGTEYVRQVMQGLEKEGLGDFLKNDQDFVIGDILSKRKMSDEKVKIFTDRLLENSRQLSRVRKKGDNYEFSYTSGGVTYYWIPIEWTF